MVRIDDLATSVKSLLQSIDAQPPLGRFERAGEEEADPQHLARLLRACRERPRNCCAAEQRDELAALSACSLALFYSVRSAI